MDRGYNLETFIRRFHFKNIFGKQDMDYMAEMPICILFKLTYEKGKQMMLKWPTWERLYNGIKFVKFGLTVWKLWFF